MMSDWELFRYFRDDKKNIIKVVLEKDGIYKEFVPEKRNA